MMKEKEQEDISVVVIVFSNGQQVWCIILQYFYFKEKLSNPSWQVSGMGVGEGNPLSVAPCQYLCVW